MAAGQPDKSARLMSERRWKVGVMQSPWGGGANSVPLVGDGPPDIFSDLVDAADLDKAQADRAKLLALVKRLRTPTLPKDWESLANRVNDQQDDIDQILTEIGESDA